MSKLVIYFIESSLNQVTIGGLAQMAERPLCMRAVPGSSGVMPAMLIARVGISTNESMSIKDLDQYSITSKVNTHQEQ